MTACIRRPGCLLAVLVAVALLLAAGAVGVRWWVTSALISDLVGHHSGQPHPYRHRRRDLPGSSVPPHTVGPPRDLLRIDAQVGDQLPAPNGQDLVALVDEHRGLKVQVRPPSGRVPRVGQAGDAG